MNNFYLLFAKAAARFKRSTSGTAALLRATLICSLCLGGNGYVAAQPNCSGFSGTMITNFADWDWTIPTNHANYCATWAIQRPSNTNKVVVGAPWFSPINGALTAINRNQDYTKAKGWELLRMNMGGLVPIRFPYFILYNRYNATIRTFFYLSDMSLFPKGVNIAMSHAAPSNGNRNSGVLALSQPLIQSQDYYLQNQSVNNEIISYVPVFTSQSGWVFADFQAGFDSNAGNAQYSSTSLQFSVLAVTSSNISLDGRFNFQTKEDIQAGGYGIGGTAVNPASGLNNFLAKGQKVLKAFNYEDLTKFKSSFTTKASKTAATVPVPVVQSQQGALINAVASSGSASGLFKKVAGAAGSLGAAFGLISTVIGVLWPDEPAGAAAPAPFIPTVSSGTLSLKGSISTTAPVTSVIMQIPGGQHFYPNNPTPTQTDGGDQPYYDCPLGIFNLKNTPRLNMYNFREYEGALCGYGQNGHGLDEYTCQDYLTTNYNSYQVTNDLVAVYNDAAGLKLQSVQAALVVETSTAEFNMTKSVLGGDGSVTEPNLMYQRVLSGETEVIAATDSLVTHATPFIDLGSFKNQAITATSGSKVYVRIKALLQRKDAASDSPPILFVQDYAIQAQPSTVATNPRFAIWNQNVNLGNGESPFSNLASALVGPIRAGFSGQSGPSPLNFASTAPYLIPAGNYTSPLVISSFTTISAGQTSLNPASGSVTLDHPSVAALSLFLSTTGIALGPGFSVTPGTNFVAATPLQAWRQGGPALIESLVGPCSYNANTNYNPVAYRGGKPSGAAEPGGPAVTVDALTLSPNPTDGLITIATAVAGETGAVVVVSDYMGKEVQRIETIPAGLSNQQINLTGRASGLYFVRLITSKGAVTQKVLLQ